VGSGYVMGICEIEAHEKAKENSLGEGGARFVQETQPSAKRKRFQEGQSIISNIQGFEDETSGKRVTMHKLRPGDTSDRRSQTGKGVNRWWPGQERCKGLGGGGFVHFPAREIKDEKRTDWGSITNLPRERIWALKGYNLGSDSKKHAEKKLVRFQRGSVRKFLTKRKRRKFLRERHWGSELDWITGGGKFLDTRGRFTTRYTGGKDENEKNAWTPIGSSKTPGAIGRSVHQGRDK